MTGPTKTSEPTRIRLVFQLERAELPRLYDELARFHKGVKRVGRLRTLAYEGLLDKISRLYLAKPADTLSRRCATPSPVQPPAAAAGTAQAPASASPGGTASSAV